MSEKVLVDAVVLGGAARVLEAISENDLELTLKRVGKDIPIRPWRRSLCGRPFVKFGSIMGKSVTIWGGWVGIGFHLKTESTRSWHLGRLSIWMSVAKVRYCWRQVTVWLTLLRRKVPDGEFKWRITGSIQTQGGNGSDR